jgi:hypothetical protein
MNYVLKPGNIASVLYVTTENGKTFDCIYAAENKPVEVWPNQTIEVLPIPVRAAVNKHFGTMFALPLERRGAYIKSLIPWVVRDEAAG